MNFSSEIIKWLFEVTCQLELNVSTSLSVASIPLLSPYSIPVFTKCVRLSLLSLSYTYHLSLSFPNLTPLMCKKKKVDVIKVVQNQGRASALDYPWLCLTDTDIQTQTYTDIAYRKVSSKNGGLIPDVFFNHQRKQGVDPLQTPCSHWPAPNLNWVVWLSSNPQPRLPPSPPFLSQPQLKQKTFPNKVWRI